MSIDRPSADSPASRTERPGQLRSNTLGTGGIVFLVLAAVAPLTGMVVIAGLGIALGNGGGMPASFLIAAVVLLLFGIGYAQMSKYVSNVGGFYVYITQALGRPLGLSGAFIALAGYNCFVAGAVGTSGALTSGVLNNVFHLDLPWEFWSAVSVFAVLLLSRRGLDVSAKVLATSLVLEVGILVIFDGAVLVQSGYSLDAFSPSVVFSGSIGLGLLFAATCFIGFEATALFSEEARDPHRSIPRSTYIAVVAIGVFAALTSLALVSAIGVHDAQSIALDHLSAGDLLLATSQDTMGTFLTQIMEVLLVVSLFAALLALHNSASRYIFALSRSGVLPRALARTTNGTPRNASAAQLAFASLVTAIFAVLGLDPISFLTSSMTGFGTLAILCLQAMASVAVVVFFRRRHDRRWWSTFVAPALGGLGLIVVIILAIMNFPTMAGSDAAWIGLLPWLLPVLVVAGLCTAAFLRRNRPATYAALTSAGAVEVRELEADAVPEEVR
ncbi:amino acid permease [Nocardia sp. SYP-A9097]|uniref:APC family permease n=1 Tax=Nocardia sp. SYP-A9097 TaxID=2663237 RepID=UPI00129B5503|nr:APC family permease [Nocardia sp. SYP-A9097]MRH88450.1 amino acid permease [Nocardia sp. SYP-A9097]